jgi:beta-mannosidase
MPATVPGNVEIDLMRHGFIDDPYPADSTVAMRGWDLVDDWTYETTFDAPDCPAGGEVRIVFEGIDTIAGISLNGEPLLEVANMLIPHAAPVTGRLKPAGNRLRVVIRSTLLHARQFAHEAFQVQWPRRQASSFVRKARHMLTSYGIATSATNIS